MIRKFNYTGRKRVRRDAVAIVLAGGEGDSRRFNAAFDLEGLGLPTDARVYVEAYRASSYKRFAFGTVGNLTPAPDRSLDDIDPNVDLRFRVKVVDEAHGAGRIVGVADGLTPQAPDQDAKKREPLVPLQIVDLGERVWRLSLQEFPDGPVVLQVNSRIADIEHIAKHDRGFRTVVFPSILEQVLTYLLRIDEYDADDMQLEVQKWFRFAAELVASAPPDDPTLRDQWITDVVSAFCVRQHVREHFEQSRSQE